MNDSSNVVLCLFSRMAFVRKNKTLGAAFSQTAALVALEKNYRVHRSLLGEEMEEDVNIK